MFKTTTAKTPCARCGKGIDNGKEKIMEVRAGVFHKDITDRKGDIWQFGPDCFKRIIANDGKKDW